MGGWLTARLRARVIGGGEINMTHLWSTVNCNSTAHKLIHGNTQPDRDVCCLLVAYRPSNMLVYLRDGSAQRSLRAATLR